MDFEKFKIKEYDNWDLFIHVNQFPYIGRCYAWAKREEVNNVLDISQHEGNELFSIVIPEWNNAIKYLFNHDWLNVASLGNTSPHLHWHLIPRYLSPRKFYDIKFIDPNPTGNYSPYPKRKLEEDLILKIKSDIEGKLQII